MVISSEFRMRIETTTIAKTHPLYRTEIEIRIKKEEGVNWGFTEDAWDEDNDFDDIDGSKKPNFLKVSRIIFENYMFDLVQELYI